MKQKLQYIYSIGIFTGVLFTAYLMVARDNDNVMRDRGFSSSALRTEASSGDPAVNQLLEMEQALAKMRKEHAEPPKRLPSDAKIPIPLQK